MPEQTSQAVADPGKESMEKDDGVVSSGAYGYFSYVLR